LPRRKELHRRPWEHASAKENDIRDGDGMTENLEVVGSRRDAGLGRCVTANSPYRSAPPCCVDLDGTLIHTDLLFENLIGTLTARPWLVFWLPFWLMRGRAYLKMRIAQQAPFDPAILPYDERVLSYLRNEKDQGRVLVLATASVRPQAEAIAAHLGLFDAIIATDGGRNLRGRVKAAALKDAFGDFAYLGNDRTDVAVWRHSCAAGLANAASGLKRRIGADIPVEVEIPRRSGGLRAVIAALRPYQWVKNLLVFVPIVTANQLDNGAAWISALCVFIAFSVIASGIYVLNDLSDLAADRRHHRKRLRPFASGRVSILSGLVLAPALLVSGLAFAAYNGVLLPLLCYAAVSLGYTIRLKEMPLVDVFCLAFLYVIRIFAGGVATGFDLSLWLLGFSAFLFLGLAFIKRVAEVMTVRGTSKRLERRGYFADDHLMLQNMGMGSSYAACVMLALFVQSPEVAVRYTLPGVLWALVPLILFWQMRLWLSTTRGYMHDDPIIYSARDWVSWVASVAAVGILFVASHSHILGLG
jgi:4-hydroxybenzoate polyprenyltransferase